MSYTPEEQPQVTGTSWVMAILLAGTAWERPFLLPAAFLKAHTNHLDTFAVSHQTALGMMLAASPVRHGDTEKRAAYLTELVLPSRLAWCLVTLTERGGA